MKYALENGKADYLPRTAIEELRKQKIILPAMTTLKRVVWEARQRAEEKISKLLTSSLTPEQVEKLDRILSPMPEAARRISLGCAKYPEAAPLTLSSK